MDLSQVLLGTLSPDHATRTQATQALENASQQSLDGYLSLLARVLVDESADTFVRVAAGVAIKNTLIARDPSRRSSLEAKYQSIDDGVKSEIKHMAIKALESTDPKVGTAGAQVVAAIAFIELPSSGWPELMNILLNNITTSQAAKNENLRKATLEAIGFICEEIDPSILEAKSSEILTTVITGLRASESSVPVRIAAANALLASLDFIRANFERENERSIIMQVVCEATLATDEVIKVTAHECLNKIIQVYYEHIQPYFTRGLGQLAVSALSSPSEPVVLQAIEFWSTLCEVELDCLPSFRLAEIALPEALPALLQLLMKQSDSDDENDWNPAMAAATCLGLYAECVGDSILADGSLMRFVEQNIGQTDWHKREAAIMAFGSVLDGPNIQTIAPYAQQALPLLLQLSRDSVVAVKDSACWAIGRVVDFFHELIPTNVLSLVITELLQGLSSPPRVAVNCCWSLMSVFVHFGTEDNDEDDEYSSALRPFAEPVLYGLFRAAEREDADEHGLRNAAFQSLASVAGQVPPGAINIVFQLQQVIVNRLEAEGSNEQLIGHLCAVLQSTIKKTGKTTTGIPSLILKLLGGVGSRPSDLEEVLLLAGTVVSEMGERIEPFVATIVPHLVAAMKRHDESTVVLVSVGVVGDLCRAIGTGIEPYANELVGQLLLGLQSPILASNVKPHLIAAVGDVALAIGAPFSLYIDSTMQILLQAASAQISDPEDIDEVELVGELRENLLEAFTAIVQGLTDSTNVGRLVPYLEEIIQLIYQVAMDHERSDAQTRAALGLLGDLVNAFRAQLCDFCRVNAWVKEFLRAPMGASSTNELSESTLSVMKWAQSVVLQVAGN